TALLGAALLGLAACVDLNEDLISGLANQPYPTSDVFQALVNATYEPLRSFYAQERGFTLTEFGTDIYTEGADGSYKYVNEYTTQLNPDVDFIRDTWADFYRAINTANTAIAQAPTVQMDSSLKAQRVAEARFLRALYYFDLVQMYGPVTLKLEPTTTPSTQFTRAPVDSVYAAIIDDLKYAEATLPYVAKDYGRATKGAAQHLLAKVYLTWQRDADSAADETAKKQAGDFANAADYAQRVIKSGQYSLLPRFSDVFAFGNEKNAQTMPKNDSGVPKFQQGDTAVYVSATDSDTVRVKINPPPYRLYTPRTYSNRIFPSLNKFADPFRLSVNDVRGSRDFVVARLAETYLIAAEALLRDGRPPAEALPYINAVRRRAAIPGHEAEMDLTGAQLTLGEILNERARELAGEMQRWFDLVRAHTLLPRVKAYNPDGGPNIQPYHALRPIPRTQMDGTTCCYTQNPGY